jgi:hypothetical protein
MSLGLVVPKMIIDHFNADVMEATGHVKVG